MAVVDVLGQVFATMPTPVLQITWTFTIEGEDEFNIYEYATDDSGDEDDNTYDRPWNDVNTTSRESWYESLIEYASSYAPIMTEYLKMTHYNIGICAASA